MRTFEVMKRASGKVRKAIAYDLRISASRFNRQCRDPRITGETNLLDRCERWVRSVARRNPAGLPCIACWFWSLYCELQGETLRACDAVIVAGDLAGTSGRLVKALLSDAPLAEKQQAVAEHTHAFQLALMHLGWEFQFGTAKQANNVLHLPPARIDRPNSCRTHSLAA